MKPLEDNKRYNILLGDCLSLLKQMESESVDCIITSPPYWGMRAYDNEESEYEIGNEAQFPQYVEALTNVFAEAKRVLKKEGSFWLNLGDKYVDKRLLGMPWRVAISLMDSGWIMRNDVIWHQLKGTTVSAALKLGRRGIGIELSPEYYNISRQRIKPTLPL